MNPKESRKLDSRIVIKNLDELTVLEKTFKKGIEKKNISRNGGSRTLFEMNLSKILCIKIRQGRLLPCRVSGEDRLLLILDRAAFVSSNIDWADRNFSWQWALLDAGKTKVVARFYEDAKEKEKFLKRIDRKFFKKSVLETLWVYLKGSSPLWECELKWM